MTIEWLNGDTNHEGFMLDFGTEILIWFLESNYDNFKKVWNYCLSMDAKNQKLT